MSTPTREHCGAGSPTVIVAGSSGSSPAVITPPPDAGLQVPHEVHPRELLGLCEAGVPRVLGVRAAQSGEHGAGGGEGWWDFSFEVPCRNADGQPLGVAFPDRPKTENDHWQTRVRVMARPPPAQPVRRCPALCGESCYRIMAQSSKALFEAAFDITVQPPHVLVLRTDSSLGWDFSLAILCTACAAATCGPQTRGVHDRHVVVIDVDAGASQRTQGWSIDRTCPTFTEAPYIFGGSGGACLGTICLLPGDYTLRTDGAIFDAQETAFSVWLKGTDLPLLSGRTSTPTPPPPSLWSPPLLCPRLPRLTRARSAPLRHTLRSPR